MLNFNVEHIGGLACHQFLGDAQETFFAAKVLRFIPNDFDVIDTGVHDVEYRKFSISGNHYTIMFSPSLEFYPCPNEINTIETVTGQALNYRTFEVKFDLDDNLESGDSFAPPKNRLTKRELEMFGFIITTTIDAHQELKSSDMYTASAVREGLNSFYKRLAIKYSARLGYELYSAFGENGAGYAFKKIK